MKIINIFKRIQKDKNTRGFTLVELLIVIGLLGAIALIVIAAINPIEQSNRARDTRFKADSGQLVSAIERYFAARSAFPWVTVGVAASNEAAFGFVTASSEGVGVCGATCSADGELLSALELKSEFQNRDFIQNGGGSDNTKKIYIGKAIGSSSSVYGCFVPMSKSTRDKSCADGNVYTVNTSNGTRSAVATGTCTGATWSVTAGSEWMVCVPE